MKEKKARRHLAAAFRWAARLDMHEAVANHFSAAVSEDGSKFLLNPFGRHFSQIKASNLLLLDASLAGTVEADPATYGSIDRTAWYLHAHLHQRVPRARVVLHTHMPYATALACLKDFKFLMLDQKACRFYDRIGYDHDYAGMFVDDSEGERVANLLGDNNSVLFLGNHGVLVIGATVADAFDELYHLEQACKLQVLALSTGRPLSLIDDEVAAHTCKQWIECPAADEFFGELRAILDREEPEYAS